MTPSRRPALLAASLLTSLLLPGGLSAAMVATPVAAVGVARPLAVLGDSDSAGYQDTISLPSPKARGGAFRARSLQWTEVLAQLRPQMLDLGLREQVGEDSALDLVWTWLTGDAPRARKLDHRHNFALSGWGCDSLLDSHRAQVPALLSLIESEPEHWREGVVVIRIGVNDFGQAQSLEALAADPQDPAVNARIQRCLQQIEAAADALQNAQPGLWLVLVGIFDNSHWAPLHTRWQDPLALAHIGEGLDRFDAGLRRLAEARPRRLFFDERAWFAGVFGGRDAEGKPAYRSVRIGGNEVHNSVGDSPNHAVLADGHAGTAWNALWAKALLQLLATQLPPPTAAGLSDDEIAALLR